MKLHQIKNNSATSRRSPGEAGRSRMKTSMRILGLSVLFLALTPTAMARSIDDFAFPNRSSQSSAVSSSSSSEMSTSSAMSSSSVSSAKKIDFRVPVKFKPPLTTEERSRAEAVMPETRAGFVNMIVHRLYNNVTIDTCFWTIASELPPEFSLVFTDVPTDHPYAKEICVAMRDGIIRGYGDGSFRPDAPVSFAEASKMISRAYGLNPWPDVTYSMPWFDQYVKTLDARGAIPSSIRSFDQRMVRADMSEILDRLDGNITSRPITSLPTLQADWAMRYPVRTPARAVSVTKPSTGSSSSKASAGKSTSSAASQASSVRSYPAWIY